MHLKILLSNYFPAILIAFQTFASLLFSISFSSRFSAEFNELSTQCQWNLVEQVEPVMESWRRYERLRSLEMTFVSGRYSSSLSRMREAHSKARRKWRMLPSAIYLRCNFLIHISIWSIENFISIISNFHSELFS